MKAKTYRGWKQWGKNRGTVKYFSDKGKGKVWVWSNLKYKIKKKGIRGSWGSQETININPVKAASCVCYPILCFFSFLFLYVLLLRSVSVYFYLFFSIFRERGREGERKRNTDVRNIDWLSLAHPQLGTWSATHGGALTGNWTGDLSVCRPALTASPSNILMWKNTCKIKFTILSIFKWMAQ